MHIRNRNDFLMGLFLLLGAAFLFRETFLFREIFSYSFGPRVFPRIILGIMGLLSICLMAQSVAPGSRPGACSKVATPLSLESALLRGGTLLSLLAYIALLPPLGYVAATIPFLFAAMAFLGPRTPRKLVLYAGLSVGITLLLKYIFGVLLKFFLP